MTDSLRENMEPLVLYDVRNPKPAEGFKENRYSLEDWEINNQSVASLHPLASASQMLEGKNYPTSNLVLPSMYGCIESLSSGVPVRQPWDGKLLQPNELRSEVVKGRAVLHADMLRRWKTEISEPLERFYFIATICDPRQKELQFPGVSTEARVKAHAWFLAEYESLWRKEPVERMSGPAPTSVSAPALAPVPAQVSAAPAPSLGSFQDFMTGLAHLNPSVAATSTVTEPSVKSEAELYLEMPAPPMHEDVLKWWASNETKFPALSVMARQYLSVPATSASAERLFSVAGRTYDDLRQNLKDEMLETTMWARINREKRHGNRSV